ncbi:hypothetical protein ES702_07674 [subsurface metagenome]
MDNKKSQIEVLKMIDDKLNELYADLISSNPGHIQVVTFNLLFILKLGSVQGTVSFESVAKLKG